MKLPVVLMVPPVTLSPTVFSDVRPGSALEQEEVFGPVLAIVPYESEDEAVKSYQLALEAARNAKDAGAEANSQVAIGDLYSEMRR